MYSIIITSYECYGKGSEFLKENLLSIFSQTYRPIQCIVSDHSRDNVIEDMVKTLNPNGVEFIYVRYSKHYGNPCDNWNNALKYATGDYIHYLAMDDRLADDTAVQDVVEFMKQSNPKWVALSQKTSHNNEKFTPSWNNDILNNNSISGPSAIVLDKSIKHITLDPNFTWFLDIDWYYRLYRQAGKPEILDKIIWINRVHPHQLTRTVCTSTQYKQDEYNKLIAKYGYPLPKSF
jgi:glycosyltransferase involved in cell wall biosynthesis